MADGDEAEIYDGTRAYFPLSFGKQTKAPTSLEAIHNTTRRTLTPNPSSSSPNIPSVSSSSKAWLKSLRRPNPNPNHETHDSDHSKPHPAVAIGPNLPEPRESAAPDAGEDEDGEEMIGPPPPPPSNEEDDGAAMIGPPRPPPSNAADSEMESEEEVEENPYRIPLSNEIVLKGHTKVRPHLDFFLNLFLIANLTMKLKMEIVLINTRETL